MDPQTLAAYDRAAAEYAQDWETQPPPSDMYAMLTRHFQPGPTADIGCGSGRDTAWLAGQGFAATGYDASPALLAEARARHPGIDFMRAALPQLEDVAEGAFANVLCETVIMHLPAAILTASVRRLTAILRPGGVLYLSWRVTRGADRRDDHGRLYAAFDPALVLDALAGCAMLEDEQEISASSGKIVRRLMVRV